MTPFALLVSCIRTDVLTAITIVDELFSSGSYKKGKRERAMCRVEKEGSASESVSVCE